MAVVSHTLRGQNAHFISEEDLVEAKELARTPRLPRISRTNPTIFHFPPIPCGGHSVQAEVSIRPIPYQTSQNYFYKVFVQAELVRAEPCQDDIQLHQLYEAIQIAYDALVPIPWEINRQCCKILYASAEAAVNPPASTHDSEEQERVSTTGNTTPSALPELPTSRERWHCHNGESETESDQAESDGAESVIEDEPVRKSNLKEKNPQKRRSNQHLASNLVDRILAGQKLMKERKQTITDRSQIQDILSERQQKGDADTLRHLASAFVNHRKTLRKSYKLDSFVDWYYQGCLDRMYRLVRQERNNKRTAGVFLINLIMNILAVTDGAVALTVPGCLAEYCHQCREATKYGLVDLLDIAMLTATGLHGKLEPPPDWYRIPNVAIWVSVVRQISFEDACCDLGMPNLAALGLEPQWTKASYGNTERQDLALTVEYSVAAAKWSLFEQGVEGLSGLRRLLHGFRTSEPLESCLPLGQGNRNTTTEVHQLLLWRRLFNSGSLTELRLALDSATATRWLQLRQLRRVLELRRSYDLDKSLGNYRELLRSPTLSDLLGPAELFKVSKQPELTQLDRLQQVLRGKEFEKLGQSSLSVAMLSLAGEIFTLMSGLAQVNVLPKKRKRPVESDGSDAADDDETSTQSGAEADSERRGLTAASTPYGGPGTVGGTALAPVHGCWQPDSHISEGPSADPIHALVLTHPLALQDDEEQDADSITGSGAGASESTNASGVAGRDSWPDEADGNHSSASDPNSLSDEFVFTRPAQMGASPGDEVGMALLLAAARQGNSQTVDDSGSRHGPILDAGSTSLTAIESTGNGSDPSSGSVGAGGGLENSEPSTSGGTAPTPYDGKPAGRNKPHVGRRNSSDLSSEGADAVGIPGHNGEETSLGGPAARLLRPSDLDTGLGESAQHSTARGLFSEGGDPSVMLAATYTDADSPTQGQEPQAGEAEPRFFGGRDAEVLNFWRNDWTRTTGGFTQGGTASGDLDLFDWSDFN